MARGARHACASHGRSGRGVALGRALTAAAPAQEAASPAPAPAWWAASPETPAALPATQDAMAPAQLPSPVPSASPAPRWEGGRSSRRPTSALWGPSFDAKRVCSISLERRCAYVGALDPHQHRWGAHSRPQADRAPALRCPNRDETRRGVSAEAAGSVEATRSAQDMRSVHGMTSARATTLARARSAQDARSVRAIGRSRPRLRRQALGAEAKRVIVAARRLAAPPHTDRRLQQENSAPPRRTPRPRRPPGAQIPGRPRSRPWRPRCPTSRGPPRRRRCRAPRRRRRPRASPLPRGPRRMGRRGASSRRASRRSGRLAQRGAGRWGPRASASSIAPCSAPDLADDIAKRVGNVRSPHRPKPKGQRLRGAYHTLELARLRLCSGGLNRTWPSREHDRPVWGEVAQLRPELGHHARHTQENVPISADVGPSSDQIWHRPISGDFHRTRTDF